jgi:bifunctional non-homologous end joining protein LigD
MAKTKLSLYQQKRDFTKTAEPSDKTQITPAEYPRFVIQKHAATRCTMTCALKSMPSSNPGR